MSRSIVKSFLVNLLPIHFAKIKFSFFLLQFKAALRTPIVAEISILELADKLNNHTKFNSYTNPIDIATVIDLLGMLVETQVSGIIGLFNKEIDHFALSLVFSISFYTMSFYLLL